MARDIKLNYLQFTAAQLRKRLKMYTNPSKNKSFDLAESEMT
jgi:hypothetical protein